MPSSATRHACLLFCLAAVVTLFPRPAAAYIDMPAEKLTLPRLMLEFRSCGVYEIDRLQPTTGAVRFKQVDVLQGQPADVARHVIMQNGKIPPELQNVKQGSRALLFGPDPYRRGIAFAGGSWYVTNLDAEGWWRLAYTASHYDFRCAFDGTLEQLIDSCRRLLDGDEVAVPCRPKPKEPVVRWLPVTLREPHRRDLARATAEAPATAPASPVPDARPFEALLVDLRSTDWRARVHAARAIRGPAGADRAVPPLTDMAVADKDPFARREAAIALGRLGPEARPAIPRLLSVLRGGYEGMDDVAAWEASRAILRIDPDAAVWPAVIADRLKDPKSEVRRKALDAVAILGPAAKVATPIALAGLEDASPDVRYAAAGALDRIDADPEVAAAPLAALLGDKNRDVRHVVGVSLRRMGAPGVREAAKRLSGDEELTVRREAAKVLADLGTAAKEVRGALEAAARDEDPEVREAALRALRHLPK